MFIVVYDCNMTHIIAKVTPLYTKGLFTCADAMRIKIECPSKI